MGAQRSIAQFLQQKFVLRVFHHLFLRDFGVLFGNKLFEEGTTILSYMFSLFSLAC